MFADAVAGWEFNRSRNASDYVLPEELTSVISGKNICSNKNTPHVLLIVCSSTENFPLRNAIRQTWANLSYEKFNISVAFLMGVSKNKRINVSFVFFEFLKILNIKYPYRSKRYQQLQYLSQKFVVVGKETLLVGIVTSTILFSNQRYSMLFRV